MKKHVLIMSIMTLIVFGCSTKESEDILETNLELSSTKMLQNLVDNEDFRAYFNPKSNRSSTANLKSNGNNGNGVMFIEDGQGGFWLIGIRDDNGTPDDESDDFTGKLLLLGGNSGDIQVLPNGKAKAHSSSNNVFCGVIDLTDFSSLSNDCYDVKGHFNLKITGTLVEIEDPWGTFYFINEDSLFLHANNITVSNETVTYDEETGEPLYCNGDATVEKSVSVNLTGDGMGPLEGTLIIE